MAHKVEDKIGSQIFSIETGRMAKLADGAVEVSYGDAMVLTTVVKGPLREMKAGNDFLPLTVDYREKTSAAGKIPGGFFKREGRPTTKEILTMRLIDRPIRPLFPEGFANEIQIMSMVLSAEKECDPDILALNGASAALCVSDLPFQGPVGALRVGQINQNFIVNPNFEELRQSTLDLVIAGTDDAVIMVEGSTREISEEILISAISFGHEQIKKIVKLQKELREKAKPIPSLEIETRSSQDLQQDTELYDKIKGQVYDEIKEKIKIKSKQERSQAFSEIEQGIIARYIEKVSPEEKPACEDSVTKVLSQLKRESIRELIFQGKRIDGRGLTDIRSITCEVGILPRNHGSALFTRGETQALVVATLGTSDDEQRIDGLADEYTKRFILHYNFPPFSVGETKPVRGPSRREIGHGNLVERALEAVLPSQEEFPYTIRVVSDILESNGSSSMASVCGGTLCLMDAGVPIKASVAGIAMGLVKEGDKVKIISDILGNEDKHGDMDFKIAGTARGITAVQMDIKTKGLTTEIMKQALDQARVGRLFILEKMQATLAQPRPDLSAYAPRIVRIKINPDKIGRVIGPGGKMIRKIEAETKADIEIEEEGVVNIYSVDPVGLEKAKKMVEELTEEAEVGKIYRGEVTGIKEFGAFVEILPGQEGLVHVSALSADFVRNAEEIVSIGDKVPVKVIAVEGDRIRLSLKDALAETGETLPRKSAAPPRVPGRPSPSHRSDKPAQGGKGPPSYPQRKT